MTTYACYRSDALPERCPRIADTWISGIERYLPITAQKVPDAHTIDLSHIKHPKGNASPDRSPGRAERTLR